MFFRLQMVATAFVVGKWVAYMSQPVDDVSTTKTWPWTVPFGSTRLASPWPPGGRSHANTAAEAHGELTSFGVRRISEVWRLVCMRHLA